MLIYNPSSQHAWFVIIEKEDSFMHRIFYMEWTAGRDIFLPSKMIVANMCMFWFLHCCFFFFFNSSIFQYISLDSYIIKLLFFLAMCLALKNLISIFHSIQDFHEIKWDVRAFYAPVISSVRRFPWSFIAKG